MTIDEALKRIKQSSECYVVWRTDTGEIIKVNNLGNEVRFDNLVNELSNMINGIGIQDVNTNIEYASRFLSSREIDKQFLEKQQREFLQVVKRVNVLNDWTRQPVDALITILETSDFPSPTSTSDIYILLERIFDFHWQEIKTEQLMRLWNLINDKKLSHEDETKLKFHLLFFEKKKEDFVSLWKEVFDNKFVYVSDFVAYYAGDLQIDDEVIINDLINVIDTPNVLFGAKYPAMIALGKIGSAAGDAAAQVIEKVIYDSTPEIIKVRDLVLERIRTASDIWRRCTQCHYGKIVGQYGDMIGMNNCPECLSLGWLKT